MKVLIGGIFDFIHSAHIKTIQFAKKYGNYLIVNVSPNERVREKKGKNHPIFSVKERMFIVKNIKGVDKVTCIKCSKNLSSIQYDQLFIKKIKPDIFIRLGYNREIANLCKEMGIKYIIRKKEMGKMHSADIINRISTVIKLNFTVLNIIDITKWVNRKERKI